MPKIPVGKKNEENFQQINVHFAFCGFVGIRGIIVLYAGDYVLFAWHILSVFENAKNSCWEEDDTM